MSRRYSRVLSAARYYAAIDNYLKYIADSTKRGSRVGTGDPRPKSKVLYVDPFGIALADNQVVKVTAAEPTWTARSAQFSGYTKATAPSDPDLIIPVANFRAARVVITTGRGTQGVKKVSAVTGMPYLSYGGKSTSVPFGKKVAADTELGAFNDIKTAVLAAVSGAIVTLQPEKI